MSMKRIAFAAALLGTLALPAFAQAPTTATTPTTPARPAVTAPTTAPAAPTTAPAAPKATAAKSVNINTATAKELDTLPGVGAARSKSILAERAKGSFKDWADFDKRMTGTNVNTGVRKKIKDMVTF
jgi:DNA uptake protein ComE-like DNA-binding protein